MHLTIRNYDPTLLIHQSGTGTLTIADNPALPLVISNTFAWKPVLIQFISDENKTSYFPACQRKTQIVLTPHFSYAPATDPHTATLILQLLHQQGYTCQWRLFQKVSPYYYDEKVTTFLQLASHAESQFSQFTSPLRRKIRKAEANGLLTKTGKTELLHDFYSVYTRNMHQLGSPALPLKWFSNLLNEYTGGEALIFCTYHENKPIGAAFLLGYQGFFEACWVATLRSHNKLYTTYNLYWTIIRYCIEQKGNTFSFGRSSEHGGVHKYKQQWGGTDHQLIWNYNQQQKTNLRQLKFLSHLWKLLPLPLARLAGPYLSRYFY